MKKHYKILLILVILFFVGAGCLSEKTEEATNTAKEVVTNKAKAVVNSAVNNAVNNAVGEIKNEAQELVQGEKKTIEMTAKKWEFNPATITVNQGDEITLKITSQDVTHGFSLPEFDVSANLEPGKTTTVNFVADQKGNFTFSCSVFCGTGHSDMKGTLVVQ